MADISVTEAGTYQTLHEGIAAASTGQSVEISGTWTGDDEGQVSFASKVITVTCVGDAKNSRGYTGRNNGSYRLVGVNSEHVFTLTSSSGLIISDVDIAAVTVETSDEIFRCAGGEHVSAYRCYIGFQAEGGDTEQDVYYGEGASTPEVYFESCMFFNVGRSVVDLYNFSGTAILNFLACSSFNIGSYGGRSDGCIMGAATSGTPTITVNVFNCAFSVDDTYTIAAPATGTLTVNWDYSYCNISTAISGADTENTDNTEDTTYTFTDDADPGVGNKVGMVDVTTSPYNLILTDHANNDAKDAHSDEVGDNSSLSLSGVTDIIGTAYSAPYCLGAFEIAAAGGTPSIDVSDSFNIAQTLD